MCVCVSRQHTTHTIMRNPAPKPRASSYHITSSCLPTMCAAIRTHACMCVFCACICVCVYVCVRHIWYVLTQIYTVYMCVSCREQYRLTGTLAVVSASDPRPDMLAARQTAWDKLSDAARAQVRDTHSACAQVRETHSTRAQVRGKTHTVHAMHVHITLRSLIGIRMPGAQECETHSACVESTHQRRSHTVHVWTHVLAKMPLLLRGLWPAEQEAHMRPDLSLCVCLCLCVCVCVCVCIVCTPLLAPPRPA